MKYILITLNHILGKPLWLLEIYLNLCLILFLLVFGFVWDFKNHVGKKEVIGLKNSFFSFSKFTVTNIIEKIASHDSSE